MGTEKRDSDDDIRKYLPDLKTILRHADPAYSDEVLREAMDNPELDAALEERKRGLEALEQGRTSEAGARHGELSTPPGVPGAVPLRVSAPSPWAKAASGDAIDKSALPSASAPKTDVPAAAPVTSPIRPANEARPPKKRGALPMWVLPGMLAIALSPFAMWAVVSMLPPRHPVELPASAVPSTQATAPAPSAALTSTTTVTPAALSPDRVPLPATTVDAGAVAPPSSAVAESPRPVTGTMIKKPPKATVPVAPASATVAPTDPPPPPKMIN